MLDPLCFVPSPKEFHISLPLDVSVANPNGQQGWPLLIPQNVLITSKHQQNEHEWTGFESHGKSIPGMSVRKGLLQIHNSSPPSFNFKQNERGQNSLSPPWGTSWCLEPRPACTWENNPNLNCFGWLELRDWNTMPNNLKLALDKRMWTILKNTIQIYTILFRSSLFQSRIQRMHHMCKKTSMRATACK